MRACACVYTCANVCHMEARGWHQMSSSLTLHLHFETTLTEPRTDQLARLAGQWVSYPHPGPTYLCSPVLELQLWIVMHSFYVCAGESTFKSSHLHSRYYTQGPIVPAPERELEKQQGQWDGSVNKLQHKPDVWAPGHI